VSAPHQFPVIRYLTSSADCELAVLASRRPVPFKADIKPRFPEAVALLAGERELQD
jgi:hypothetical protein